ncbi:MAG: serine hydrolase, partial [bacterium]|nr:serine hydrolase [bacterium]
MLKRFCTLDGNKLSIFLLTIFFLSLFACGQEFRLSLEWEEAIERFSGRISRDITEDNIGCITVAAVKEGKVIWARGFGLADRENNITAEPVTIGRTGSISKSFTAILMMILVEKGVISLDEPIEKY